MKGRSILEGANGAERALPVLRTTLAATALLLVGLLLAGCGGGDGSSASQEAESTAAAETVTPEPEPEDEDTDTAMAEEETMETAEAEESGGSAASGPAPAPGTGRVELDDGRSFAITITECSFQPSGTFEVRGTSDQGATFSMTQFYLGDDWSQSQVSIEFPNSDQIYVIVSRATADAEPATVEGKNISWTQTFKELDESANRHVYTGQGTVRLTCT